MKAVFADTLYWIAIVRPNDPWREQAERARHIAGPAKLVTTHEVLSEFLTALSGGGAQLRSRAVETVRRILSSPDVMVISQSRDSFLKALNRYFARLDKQCSLTDCSSMNVMEEEGIREVLTNDRHFDQEGFEVLIKAKKVS
jgi:uncharacterized protein